MFHPCRSGLYLLARIKVFLSLFCASQLDEQKQAGQPFLMRSDILVQAVCINFEHFWFKSRLKDSRIIAVIS
jgi:hypothetical protein